MRLIAAALVAITFSGCLLSHEHKRVIREKEPLRPVRFQSPETAEKFSKLLGEHDRTADGSSFSLGIPFLLGLSAKTVPSTNAHYNDHALRCDTNGDCYISDSEVDAYASR